MINPEYLANAMDFADRAREQYAVENGKAIDKSKISQESLDYMAGLADFGENIALEHAHPDEAEWEDWGQVSACLQHIREELTGVMIPYGTREAYD